MLTAKTEDGKIISLGREFDKEELIRLRKIRQFFCPICSAKLNLKVGKVKIPHFAHERNSHCSASYDHESPYHLLGKLRIFHWLESHGLSPQLETYFPNIQQRADVAFTYKEKMYAIEFQCSPLSEEIFQSRTAGYKKMLVTPIWLLGGKKVKRVGANKINLSQFQYLFLRKNNEQYYIPAFCPEINHFIFCEDILPLSSQMAFAHFSLYKPEQLHPNVLLCPIIQNWHHEYKWIEEIGRVRQKIFLYPTDVNRRFFQVLYQYSVNPHFLPTFVGIPLRHGHIIETNPLIWQTYLLLELLLKNNGREVTFHKMYKMLLGIISEGKIKLRSLPQLGNSTLPLLIKEYLQVLEKIGMLKKKKEHIYERIDSFKVAKTMEEWECQQKMLQEKLLRR